MCLAIPGRIVAVTPEGPEGPSADIDYGSTRRRASLLYLPDAQVGEYVVVHAGFATERVSEAEAREALEYARQIDTLARPAASAEPSVA